MAFIDGFNAWLQDNLLILIVIAGVGFGFYWLFKRTEKMKIIPDYIKTFQEQDIKDQALNKPDRTFGLKLLFRGHELLGQVLTYDEQEYFIRNTTNLDDPNAKIERSVISTVTFKKTGIMNYFAKAQILRFIWKKTGVVDHKGVELTIPAIEGKKLVFPANTSFTALGHQFVTNDTYPQLSRIIDDNWNKRLFEANTNILAGRMALISGETPEYAQERKLKELEIEKIRAEKQFKMGSMI